MKPSNQAGGRPRGAAGGKSGGERRKRTHFSPAEVAILVEAFAKDPYPGFEERERLASRVQKLEPRVHVWFQNRRARQLRSTNVKVERNKGSLLQNIQLWSQPRESPSHAAAAQHLVNEPSQPGRSWHLHHPLQHWGQCEQTSDLQHHQCSFGSGQVAPFPQSSFGLAPAAKNVQPGFGGARNLPMIQQQEQQNTFNQTAFSGNSYTGQSLQPSGNQHLGGQACTPCPRLQSLTYYSDCNQGGVEENNYAHTSLTGISPVLYSNEFQLEKKTSSFGDNLSRGSRSDMSLGYGSNMTTPSPSAQCQEGLQEQIPPSHVVNQPVTEHYPLWPATGNDYLQELCKILANE